MFWTAAAGLFCAILLLDAASGRFDLLTRARAHPDSANCHGARQITICKHLCRALACADEAGLDQRLRRHFGAFRHASLEIAQTNDLMLNAKDIGKSALRQSPRERHLAALEMRLAAAGTVMACARLHSLVSLSGRLSRSRSRSAAKPLAVTVRAGRRHEIVKPDVLDAFDARAALDHRGICLLSCRHCLFLYRRHFYEMTHAFDLSTQGRRILEDHLRLVIAQPESLEREAHAPRVPDPAANLLDANTAARQLRLRSRARTLRVPPYVSSSQVVPPLPLLSTGIRSS